MEVRDSPSMSCQEVSDAAAIQEVVMQLGQKPQKIDGRKRKITADDGNPGQTAEIALSKAAARMRQYRADRKNDKVWHQKERERMKKIFAARKGIPREPLPSFSEMAAAVKLGKKIVVERKPYQRAGMIKKNADGTVGTPEPVVFPVAVDEFGNILTEDEAAAAALVAKTKKRDEFRKKEAERIKKYRALSRQDQGWKDKDAERMRLYRAKRKTGPKGEIGGTDINEVGETGVVDIDAVEPAVVPTAALVPTASDVSQAPTATESSSSSSIMEKETIPLPLPPLLVTRGTRSKIIWEPVVPTPIAPSVPKDSDSEDEMNVV